MWLATLSTVVGVATGMFTLRDEVFPEESGTAGAISENAYRADVGEICDQLNEDATARRRDDRRLGKQLRAARSTLAQRDALLDAARRSAGRSSHALAEFAALTPPRHAVVTARSTTAVWTQNQDRLQAYVERLDRASGRHGLMGAVTRLSRDRSAFARDGLRVHTGLKQLGANRCVIDPPVVSPTLTLPPDPQAPRRAKTPTPTTAPSAGSPRVTPTPTPVAERAQVTPRVNTPSTSAPNSAPTPQRPRVNTPSTDGPVSGGGEAG